MAERVLFEHSECANELNDKYYLVWFIGNRGGVLNQSTIRGQLAGTEQVRFIAAEPLVSKLNELINAGLLNAVVQQRNPRQIEGYEITTAGANVVNRELGVIANRRAVAAKQAEISAENKRKQAKAESSKKFWERYRNIILTFSVIAVLLVGFKDEIYGFFTKSVEPETKYSHTDTIAQTDSSQTYHQTDSAR